jgi:PAS domain S-box-containing protein
MSSLIFSTRKELKRTFVITDLEQGLNRLTFDLESLGCDVTQLFVKDSAALQDALASIDSVDLFVLFCSGKHDEAEYQARLQFVVKLFPQVKIILISREFSIRQRLMASEAGIKTHLMYPYDRFQLQNALLDAFEPINQKIFKILLVDNYPQTAETMLGFMRQQGFELEVLTDPYGLYDRVQYFDCDLLFLRLTGDQFCCRYMTVIKEIEAIKGVSIIVLSDKNACVNEDHCLSTHADACLSLPYEIAALARIARIHAQRSQVAKRHIRRFNAHYFEREREHSVLDIHALVSATDRFGRITYVNDNFCQTSGYTSHELLGNNHRLVKSGIHDATFYKAIWGTIASGQVWKGEICNKRKDGSLYWVDSTIAGFLDDQGEIYQYISIRKDITTRKLVEKQLYQAIDILERTNEAARIGFWEYSLDEKALLWSKVTREIHGVEEDYQPTVEEAISFYRPGANRESIETLFSRAVNDHLPYDTELVITDVDGEECWVRTIGIPDVTEDGSCSRVYGLFQDITDKKHMMLSLVHAKEAAETANIAKSQFLSQMSHELRTPLNAILGFAQILQDSVNLNDEEQNDVAEIYKAGSHLLALINEVLDLSAVESGHLNFSYEPVRIRELIAESLQLLTPLIQKRQIQVIVNIDSAHAVKVDRGRLKQILLNLLSNAVKYNKDQGAVKLATQLTEENKIRIEVADSGQGLTREQLKHLFKPFNRLGKEKEGVEGTGIGLALSKSLAELMGGKIGAESEFGQGSRFWLEFPLARETRNDTGLMQATGTSSAMKPGNNQEQKTILYVEDNPANLKLVAHILSSRQHVRLLAAMSPQQAIELALDEAIDVVLMDINLPEMSGFDLAALLKREPAFQTVPFVAISADATKTSMHRASETGFIDYLTKPLDIKRFNSLIDSLLSD